MLKFNQSTNQKKQNMGMVHTHKIKINDNGNTNFPSYS